MSAWCDIQCMVVNQTEQWQMVANHCTWNRHTWPMSEYKFPLLESFHKGINMTHVVGCFCTMNLRYFLQPWSPCNARYDLYDLTLCWACPLLYYFLSVHLMLKIWLPHQLDCLDNVSRIDYGTILFFGLWTNTGTNFKVLKIIRVAD